MWRDARKLPKGFKMRSHHNGSGRQQTKSGRTASEVERIARRLGIPYLAREEARRRQGKLSDAHGS